MAEFCMQICHSSSLNQFKLAKTWFEQASTYQKILEIAHCTNFHGTSRL